MCIGTPRTLASESILKVWRFPVPIGVVSSWERNSRWGLKRLQWTITARTKGISDCARFTSLDPLDLLELELFGEGSVTRQRNFFQDQSTLRVLGFMSVVEMEEGVGDDS